MRLPIQHELTLALVRSVFPLSLVLSYLVSLTSCGQMGCVFMGQSISPSSPVDPSSFTYVVGIDIGSQTCSFCTLKPDKSQVIKPTDFANAPAGFASLLEQLERLEVLSRADSDWPGGDLALRGESLPLAGKSRLSALPAASAANPSVCATTWIASENGQTGCWYHRSCAALAVRLVVAMCRRT